MHVLPKPPPGDEGAHPRDEAPKFRNAQEAARIYFLPNLFTAGNLFFGFVAIIFCIQARYVVPEDQVHTLYTKAVECILLAALCDALDGRLARLGGRESLFGMEFDSIADTVSFGVAPALMVFFLILGPDSEKYSALFQEVGWLIGFIYLLCVAVRLARFNVLTNPLVPGVPKGPPTKDFMGLPSPAAAGFVASLVLVILNLDFSKEAIQQAAILFLPLLLLVALLMVSNIPYPSFKHIDWQTQTRAQPFILLVVAIAIIATLQEFSFAILFLAYIFYGLGGYWRRAWLRRKQRAAGADKTTPAFDVPEEDEDAF
jgi:CDP-diacylglycerol---serine O-phosphatidyltransferase